MSKTFNRYIIILAIIVFIVRIIMSVQEDQTNNNVSSNKEEIVKEIVFEVEVYEYIQSLNISHPDIVFAQARIESGNFQSKLFLDYNNMFGMKMPNNRPTLAIGKTSTGFAIFNSWKESIIDYAIYQSYYAKNLTEEEYIDFLNKNYAEDPIYSIKIKKHINK